MSSEPRVVIDSRSQQVVSVSVVDDNGKVVEYRLLPGTWTPSFRYSQLTPHTHQLVDAGHITLRSV